MLLISSTVSTIIEWFGHSVVEELMSVGIEYLRKETSDGTKLLFERLKRLHMILGSVVVELKGQQVTNVPMLQWLGEVVEGLYQGQYMVDIMKHQSSSPRFYEDKQELSDLVNKLDDLSSNIDLFFKISKRCDPLDPNVTNYLNMDDDRHFGRMVEKAKIINFLLEGKNNSSNSSNVDVLTITGAEGVGKSALAKYFYNETWVCNHFSLRVWLENASLLDPAHFIKELLNEFSSNNAEQVKKMLTDRTFLLVLDNASDIDARVWTIIKGCLEHGKNGSKVIITSRMDEATGLGTVEPIILDPMPNGEYCCFIQKNVFGRSRPEGYAKLAKIAKEIASLLNGSPSAAKAMSEQLKENINIKHWKNILKTLKPAADAAMRETLFRMERNSETATRTATEANQKATMVENRVIELQGQVERMAEAIQQLSYHSRPKKRARFNSSEPLTYLPSPQHLSVFEELPNLDEEMIRRDDAGASCSYQINGPEVEIAPAQINGKGKGVQINGKRKGVQINGKGKGVQINGKEKGVQINGKGKSPQM